MPTIVGIFVEQRGEPLAGGSLAGHDDGMSQARAQVPSYESGVSDLPLLGETIGRNLRRRVARYQLAQGMPEVATATALKVPADAASQHARVTRMLQEFGAALRATAAGSSAVQTWTEPVATWRTPA
jgi:hypothetical protein